ncbi:hypothetical protein LF599_00035 [Pseudodesulfovibrio thermohalotolerans]|uniref:hypothetical protein n=1 Tax=Pseudodesulfovibrio thermohalotolerans TaxID=2880651 RepID=UPI0024427417|nr:hypothetical protein [Pseudodesulfovibrio thermohalotolerans]WFS62580.1 hypothetical protein LF599_00035 [Pseudodesulfovibrio thermohalotolerans]
MGSPSSRLNVRESLRPWLESGLEFVYAPGGLTVEAQPEPARPSARPAEQPATHPAARQAEGPAQSSAPQRPAAKPERSRPPVEPPHPSPAPQAAPQVPPRATPNFPAPWSSFLRFTKPGAKVVMTYMELGLDLGGQADPRRRSVLKNLQAHLKWPPGTINYWPMAALIDGTLQPNASMFWSGWELWHTPHIICFGEETIRVILPDADPEAVTHLLENVIVHRLPPMARFVEMLPHEQQMAVDAIANMRL